MPAALYKIGEEGLLGSINLSSDVIKARLVTASYTPNMTTDVTMSTQTITATGTDQTLASKTITLGVFDSADITYTAVAPGSAITAIVIYRFVTNDAGSTPIAYLPLSSSLTPNGGDITITWDNGSSKIFALS